jgi:hypothetical protein
MPLCQGFLKTLGVSLTGEPAADPPMRIDITVRSGKRSEGPLGRPDVNASEG